MIYFLFLALVAILFDGVESSVWAILVERLMLETFFGELILILCQQFSRCHLKIVLLLALVVYLFGREKPVGQFW